MGVIVSSMARKARIDVPGALQHIIIRGIEHRRIFQDHYVYIYLPLVCFFLDTYC